MLACEGDDRGRWCGAELPGCKDARQDKARQGMARLILLGGAALIAGQACESRLARSISKPPKWRGRLALARTVFKHICALLFGCRSRTRIGKSVSIVRPSLRASDVLIFDITIDQQKCRLRADQLENKTTAAEDWRRSSGAGPKGNGEQPFSAATMCRDTLRKACAEGAHRIDKVNLGQGRSYLRTLNLAL